MFEEFKAPDRTQPMISSKKLFLAGSIDMGEAENWQDKLSKEIKKRATNKNITVFNPRRDDWDSSWSQEINNTQFFDQVTWELEHINKSDLVIIYFTEDSKSPITLLELGKVSEMKDVDVVVFCPKGFYRKGNVDIVCYHKKIPVFEEFEEFMEEVCSKLKLNDEKESTTDKSDKKSDKDKPKKDKKEKVKESVENTLNENQVSLKSLVGDPVFEYKTGDNNTIVVENYEYIEDSCMMGKINFMGRSIYSGVCNEDGTSKVNMKIKRPNGSEEIVEFNIQKADDDNPEGIILSE